jgi:hypothetical protein
VGLIRGSAEKTEERGLDFLFMSFKRNLNSDTKVKTIYVLKTEQKIPNRDSDQKPSAIHEREKY